MIRNIRNGGGGGSSSTNDDDDSGGSYSVTSIDSDPVFGSGSGGKTGSETIAEGGAPESTVTNDPSHTSVSDKYDDPKSAFDDMVDRAHDADDGAEATFDATPNTQEGKDAIQDSVESIIGATSSDEPVVDNTDQNRAANPDIPDLPFPFPRPNLNQDTGDGLGKALVVGAVVLVVALIGGS